MRRIFSEPPLDDRNVGAVSAIRESRPEYRECMVYANQYGLLAKSAGAEDMLHQLIDGKGL